MGDGRLLCGADVFRGCLEPSLQLSLQLAPVLLLCATPRPTTTFGRLADVAGPARPAAAALFRVSRPLCLPCRDVLAQGDRYATQEIVDRVWRRPAISPSVCKGIIQILCSYGPLRALPRS